MSALEEEEEEEEPKFYSLLSLVFKIKVVQNVYRMSERQPDRIAGKLKKTTRQTRRQKAGAEVIKGTSS